MLWGLKPYIKVWGSLWVFGDMGLSYVEKAQFWPIKGLRVGRVSLAGRRDIQM